MYMIYILLGGREILRLMIKGNETGHIYIHAGAEKHQTLLVKTPKSVRRKEKA